MPIVVGPTGFAGLCAHEGEIKLARAAAAAGVPYVVGAASLTAMEKVKAQGGGGDLWLQITLWPDEKLCHKLIQRSLDAGYEGLVVMSDAPVLGNREYNRRNGFTIPFQLTWRNSMDLLHFGWMKDVIIPYLIHNGGMPQHDNYPEEVGRRMLKGKTGAAKARTRNDSISWEHLKAVRRIWPHKLIVKGVLSPKDAVLAADCGVDGIVVSNHGGRNLDGSVPPISVLPEIADAVRDRMTVFVDSGFRRGSDVVKALALGAHAVWLGRAPLYGLAAAGEEGAALALKMFRDEIDRVMAMVGANSVAELNPGYLKAYVRALHKRLPI
jgi:isopentenyl diphosphate isomerase/L-lactate dehydrogenase-like FMN-dependent dehydrogenase